MPRQSQGYADPAKKHAIEYRELEELARDLALGLAQAVNAHHDLAPWPESAELLDRARRALLIDLREQTRAGREVGT